MRSGRMKMVIDSVLENVPLIGMAINKLCSQIPLSLEESFNVEICVVEAVNNSIEHAYKNEPGHEVMVVFAIGPDELILDIYDTGTSLDQKLLENADTKCLDIDPGDHDSIPEGGRGLAIIKEIMDSVTYTSKQGEDCFTMIKKLH